MSDFKVRLRFPGSADIVGSKVHVSVEDVTVADRAAGIVGRRDDLTVGSAEIAAGQMEFVMPRPAMLPGRRLNLRVHVDKADTGSFKKGDLISTASQSPPAEGDFAVIEIPLKRI